MDRIGTQKIHYFDSFIGVFLSITHLQAVLFMWIRFIDGSIQNELLEHFHH